MNMRSGDEFNRLNDEQKQALDWTRSIAVRANAGSGKTTVLVQRIIQILHNHRDLSLDQFVAITFTRKAGAQLKEKLHKALTECIRQSSDAGDDDDRQFWQQRLDELPHCPIGTIDSLCQRLLKRAIELGLIADLDPDFGILEGLDRADLLDQAVRQTEIELKNDASWQNWLRTQGRSAIRSAIRLLVASGAKRGEFDAAVRTAEGTPQSDILRLFDLPALTEPLQAMKDGRNDLIAELDAALGEMKASPQDRTKGKIVHERMEALESLIHSTETVSDLEFISRLRSILFNSDGDVLKKGFEHQGKIYFPKLNAVQKQWERWMPDFRFQIDDSCDFELTRQLVQISEVAHRHFMSLCREENRYDYSSLAQRVVELLSDKHHARQLTEAYRYILVDEFQDTNEQQWQIVSRLAGIDPTAPIGTDKLMFVGDPQQSIYRFRKADPTVFERIIELIQQGNAQRGQDRTAYDECRNNTLSTEEQRTGLMPLRKNYRSHSPLPIRIIDILSQHAFREVRFKQPQSLEAGPPGHNEPGEVVYVLPAKGDDDADVEIEVDPSGSASIETEQRAAEKLNTRQLQMVAQQLRRIHIEHRNNPDDKRRITWKNMAILLRSRQTHLKNLEEVLRKANIPYQLVGGLGFWQRQEVRDLVCLARCLANGDDDLALFAVLRGPLCGLSDSELLFLSMLGGRKLLKGLQRFQAAKSGDRAWNEWHADPTLLEALQNAFGDIPEDRKDTISQASEWLGYDGIWRQRVDRMPHSELLRTALDESGVWGIYTAGEDGEQQLANLKMFFEEVRLLEASRGASLADLTRRLKAFVDESTNDEQAELTREDSDAVQVMTVHAAKGLEFAVVAVVGLERKFRADGESVLLLDRFQHLREDVRNSDLGQAVQGLPLMQFRDPQMALKRVKPLYYQVLKKIEWNRTVEEEARIFHVAVSRAERILILAGAGPRGKTWPPNHCWQKWVHDALGITEDTPAGIWHVPSDPTLQIRLVRQLEKIGVIGGDTQEPQPSIDLRVLSESPRRRIIAATALDFMLNELPSDPIKWEMRYRHHIQPHAGAIPACLVDGAKRDAGENVGKIIGTLVHRALEMGAALPRNSKDRRLLLLAHATSALREHGADSDESGGLDSESSASLPTAIADEVAQILADVLPNNPFKDLIEANGESEVDFALPIENWIITGRFDRLIETASGAWEIVDWKTDHRTADQIVRSYQAQMKLYALALWESLPDAERPDSIAVNLAMTSPRSSERLTFSSGDLIAYKSELAGALSAVQWDSQT